VAHIAHIEERVSRFGAIRESISRQARHHDVECVGRLAAVTGRIGEHRDDLGESKERIRKAVCEHDRERLGSLPSLVNEVDAPSAHVGPKMRPAIHRGFLSAPVELVAPVADDLSEVRDAQSMLPVVAGALDPPRPRESRIEVGEDGVGDGDGKGLSRWSRVGHSAPHGSS
jgi:hypothetical protein